MRVYNLAAGAVDGQSPHAEDEVYVVTTGAADLEVAVAFAPPESADPAGRLES